MNNDLSYIYAAGSRKIEIKQNSFHNDNTFSCYKSSINLSSQSRHTRTPVSRYDFSVELEPDHRRITPSQRIQSKQTRRQSKGTLPVLSENEDLKNFSKYFIALKIYLDDQSTLEELPISQQIKVVMNSDSHKQNTNLFVEINKNTQKPMPKILD